MVVVPAAVPVAAPEASITAFVMSEELHVTCVVRSDFELSLNFHIALKLPIEPTAILGLTGVTVIDFKVALVTLREAVPTTPANTAVMFAVPGDIR